MATLPGIDSYKQQVVLLLNKLCWVKMENWFGPKYLVLPTDKGYNKEPPNKSARILPHERGSAFEITNKNSNLVPCK